MIKECFNCGSSDISDCGVNYQIDNPFFGKMTTGNHHVFRCNECGMMLLDEKCRAFLKLLQQDIIDDYLTEHHNPAMFRQEYMTESDIIGKIGFIPELLMTIEFNGKKLFWIPSVDKFIENGKDGRLKII